jgi:hypothetical protein
VATDGTCPACGRPVDPGHAHAPGAATGAPAPSEAAGAGPAAPDDPTHDEPLPPVPWHLKLLAGSVALYLGYRAYQGIEWVIGRF